jgi:hypothetical protein
MTHLAYLIGVILTTVTGVGVLRGPGRSWLKKVKRRKGGVYVWRVDHHRNRARRVTGYVGETVSFYFRSRQHMGMSHYAGDTRTATMTRVPSQPWSDLNPRMYKVIPLPWWLCWKWVLRPLETLVILCTWPVYNDAKNRWNPRRVPKSIAQVHRAGRDQGTLTYRASVFAAHLLRSTLITVSIVVTVVIAVIAWKVFS